jgi:tetratricopeptide (TPR) repeat protein
MVQAALGASSCALTGYASARLFGAQGVIAGFGLAFYPPAIFLDGLADKSSLVLLLAAALVALLAATVARPLSIGRWLGTGVVLGFLALARENALLVVVPVLVWIAWSAPRTRWAAAAAFAAGCVLVLAPVALRNWIVGGELHLTTAQLGPNLYIGNHAGADGMYQPLVQGHGSAADEREDASRLAQNATGRQLGPTEVSRYWTSRALSYVGSHPLGWLALMGRKVALTFNAAEVSDTESQDVYAESSALLRFLRPLDFGTLLGLAAFGAVLTAASSRRLWFLYAVAATYELSVALFYVLARYRSPLVPPLMVLAAGGIVVLPGALRPRPGARVAAAAFAAVLAVLFARLPLEDTRAARATHFSNIAAALAQDPSQRDAAMRWYGRALEESPRFAAAEFGLATLLARAGRAEEALPHYQAALASWPDYQEARYNLGAAFAVAGRLEEAAREYTEVLRIRPDDVEAHIALGKTLVSSKRPDLALEHYRQVLGSNPGHVKALVGSGVALTQMGRIDEAMAAYRLALERDPGDATAHNNLGWTLASRGHIAEAVPHFERALALDPGHENARRNLEQARAALGASRSAH